MAAFGGAGAASNGAAANTAATAAAANPWDMGGLDPVPLIPGANQLQVSWSTIKLHIRSVFSLLEIITRYTISVQ